MLLYGHTFLSINRTREINQEICDPENLTPSRILQAALSRKFFKAPFLYLK
jgi:hypothetical protein